MHNPHTREMANVVPDMKDVVIPHEKWGPFMMVNEHLDKVLDLMEREDKTVQKYLDEAAPEILWALNNPKNPKAKETMVEIAEQVEEIFHRAASPFAKMRAWRACDTMETLLDKIEWK